MTCSSCGATDATVRRITLYGTKTDFCVQCYERIHGEKPSVRTGKSFHARDEYKSCEICTSSNIIHGYIGTLITDDHIKNNKNKDNADYLGCVYYWYRCATCGRWQKPYEAGDDYPFRDIIREQVKYVNNEELRRGLMDIRQKIEDILKRIA